MRGLSGSNKDHLHRLCSAPLVAPCGRETQHFMTTLADKIATIKETSEVQFCNELAEETTFFCSYSSTGTVCPGMSFVAISSGSPLVSDIVLSELILKHL